MHTVKRLLIRPEHIVIIGIALFILFFSALSILRHENFHSRRLDLGNMDQTVWNVLHGNGFTLTDPTGTSQQSRLAIHADFLLILLAPLYAIWSNPDMLLLIQVIVAGLGALPVYWIAYDTLRSKKLAVLFSCLYLLYPPMERKMLHDFHAVSLSTTFLLYAYWYMEKKRYALFTVFAVLAGLGKEDVWIVAALFGIYIAFRRRHMLFGTIVFVISACIFYTLFWIAIPAVTPEKQHFALVYLSDYGGGLNEILRGILTKPLSILQTVIAPDRLYYYAQILSPYGFLSLISPWPLIFASASILVNTLSNNQLMRQIDYQYGSLITPFIVISSIYGFAALRKKISPRYIAIYLSLCMFITVYLWGELPVGKSQWFWFFISPIPEKQTLQQIKKQIDSNSSVSATNNIGAHFSQRQYLYNFPIHAQDSDYVVVYLGDPYAWPSGEVQQDQVNKLLHNSHYEVLVQKGNLFVFKRISYEKNTSL